MKSRFLWKMLIAAAVTCCSPLHAEDIDLFVDSPSSSTNLPNVLFIVDNTANWTQAFANETAALSSVFNSLPTNADGSAKFNIGVMFSAETSSSDSNVTGGYVRAAIRPMTAFNRTKYGDMIAALDVGKDKGNGGSSSLVMAEAYRYFSAAAAYAGNNKAKADYTGNTAADWSSSATTAASKAAMQAIYALAGNALPAKSARMYNSAIGSGCAKNFIIYISNGPSQDSSSIVTQATSMLTAAGASATPIPLSPSGSQGNVSDEWARFMKQKTGLAVTTYTIEVNRSSTGQGPGWTALLNSMASVSLGKYNAVSSQTAAEISKAVNDALSEIQAVNSVFASVSLPVSVNTQGTYLNQVYVGMFRPDQNGFPRWTGNLKQYKLGYIGGSLEMLDSADKGAISSVTGFITECARSYWTPTVTDDYWSFRPRGGCIAPSGGPLDLYLNSNSPDGNVVEKGAQGYMLRGSITRTFKTCSPTFSACTSLTDFDTGNNAISQSLLGAASATERTALINWETGQDVDNENTSDGVTPTSTPTATVMRPSVHGDVVHSRPVAINFGTSASPQVVVFYGGNDGVFRAVNGNRSTNIGSVTPGSELWAFVPPEFYGSIKRIRDNTVQISFPNITTGSPLPKPYGVDGAITAYAESGKAWIYATLRRGGRAVYAFNIDPSDPAAITLKWKRGCPNLADDTGCSTGFTGIGQTWSSPKTLHASAYGSAPLLIMGGGYDRCEDADPNTCTSATKGNRIYVMDADSGLLLNTLSTDRAVVADVMVVPDATSGLAKYAYAVDLGGNVYRIDIGTNTPQTWAIAKIAALGCATGSTCSANRKFMFAPDVVENNGEYALMLGSGDREKPLLYSAPTSVTNGVANYFFMLRDRPADSTWLSSEAANCSSSLICLNSLLAIAYDSTTNPSSTDLAAKKGWYLGLRPHEQVVTSAITIFGTVTFSSHEPTAPSLTTCTSTLGTTRVYGISFSNAGSQNGTDNRSEVLPPVGLPPSPVAGMVTLDDGKTVPFCIGCGSQSPLQAEEPVMPASSVPSQPKSRVYWYIQK